jgi:hypothetical protein
MELQNLQVDWERCVMYRLHLQDAHRQPVLPAGILPAKKGPAIQLVPRREKTA